MAYLHCHNCGWSQDDFWSETGYTPLKHVAELAPYLFKERVHFDEYALHEMGFRLNEVHRDGDGTWVSGTDFVAYELESAARRVRQMRVKTSDEWRKVKDDLKCPRCGKRAWDVD